MDDRMTKSRLLDELRSTREEWEGLLSEAHGPRVTQSGAIGNWSVKDVIAHCTDYAQVHVDQLEAHLRREPPPLNATSYAAQPMSVDERNQLDFEKNRFRPLEDVLAQSRWVFEQLIDLVDAHPDEFLVEPQRFEGVPEAVLVWKQLQHVCDHYRGHLRSIREWL